MRAGLLPAGVITYNATISACDRGIGQPGVSQVRPELPFLGQFDVQLWTRGAKRRRRDRGVRWDLALKLLDECLGSMTSMIS